MHFDEYEDCSGYPRNERFGKRVTYCMRRKAESAQIHRDSEAIRELSEKIQQRSLEQLRKARKHQRFTQKIMMG